MSEKKRLHPAAIIFNFIQSLKDAIWPVAASLLAFAKDSLFYFILIVAIILVLLVIVSFISWYRYTYYVKDGELRIEYGIFVRKKRYISKGRIQSIDLTEGVIHRIFKLVNVKIETAGSGGDAEGSLKAVKLEDGKRLRDELRTQKHPDEIEDFTDTVMKQQAKVTKKRLFIAGTTSGSIGVLFTLFLFVFSQIDQFIPDSFIEDSYHYIVRLGIMFIALFILLGLFTAWLLGIAGTMIKYGNFTITKQEDELFITRGLLEKKQVTIPLKRIQSVGIEENLLRQPFGYATVYAEIASSSLGKGEDFSAVLFPLIKQSEVDCFLRTFLPEYVSERKDLTPLPNQALKYYLFRSIWLFILAIAGIMYFWPAFSWIPAGLLIASGYLGYLRYHDAGFNIHGNQLTMRYRRINRSTIILFRRRIQAYEKQQGRLQSLQNLANAEISICTTLGTGTHYWIKDMENEHVLKLADWYSHRK